MVTTGGSIVFWMCVTGLEVFCVAVVCYCVVFFFFSSRRRHTRCSRDWSSDVCSSDLVVIFSGGAAKSDADLIEEIKGLAKGGGFGSIMGRNAFQRPKTEAIKLLHQVQRSEEHTSELQSRLHLVCRLLLEKKKLITQSN